MNLELLASFTQKFIENLVGQKLFPYSMQVIILAEAAILIPMCKVLNFQKFKYLTYPILVAVMIIFMSLVFKLVERIITGKDDDFC
jgi:Na+/H+ antiporter NhaC